MKRKITAASLRTLNPTRFGGLRIACSTTALVAAFLAPNWSAAAPASFPQRSTIVTLDGAPLAGNQRWNTVAFDNGTYHMWLRSAASTISSVVHATSSDGVNYTTVATLSPPSQYWAAFPCGTNPASLTEPQAHFVRAVRNDDGWALLFWHGLQTGQSPYSYNTSIWSIGTDINNTAITQYGPIPYTGCGTSPANTPGGFHLGPFGLVNDHLYLRQTQSANASSSSLGGNMGRYALDLTTPPPATSGRPRVDATTKEADLFNGTGYWETNSVPSGTRAYVYNSGRALSQGRSVVGAYYTFTGYSSGAALEKNIWYVESPDDGVTWASPTRVYGGTAGEQVTVNGWPNTGTFWSPEVVDLGGGKYRTYMNTRDACGRYVQVTEGDAAATSALTITKSFDATILPLNGQTNMTVTVKAPDACTAPPQNSIPTPSLTQLGWTDTLPAGMTLATGVPVVSNTCGGTLTADPSSNNLALSNASLAAGASCTVTVKVQVGPAGEYNNVIAIDQVTNAQNMQPVAPAKASLRVGAPVATPVPTVGQWALILMAALLAGLAAIRMRTFSR